MRAQFHHGFPSDRRGNARFRDHRCYRRLGWFECAGHSRNRKTDWSFRKHAMLPPVIIREAVKVAKITETGGQERLLAPVEAVQIGLVWRITRRKLSGNWASWVDIDPFEVPIDQGATPQSVRVAEAHSFVAKKLKMAHIHDQGDESESHSQMLDRLPFGFTTSLQSRTDNQSKRKRRRTSNYRHGT